MKKISGLLSIMTMVLLIAISGCKNDNPVPVEKKKYAWATGAQDSTGYGMILFTPDGGETWVRQGQGSSSLQGINVSDIWAVDENNVWATGTKNSILRTTDGGQSWTSVPAPANIPNSELGPICIVNKTNIWIGGNDGANHSLVYKSTDNGSTWTMLDTTFFYNVSSQGLWAISPEKVFVSGSNTSGTHPKVFVGYTLDGGVTWDSIPTANLFSDWHGIGVVASANTIVVYGLTANYMVSFDGGNSWKHDSVPNTGGGGTGGADINDLIMLDSQTWWGAFDYGNIFITTDGGATWTKQSIGTSASGGDFLVGIDTWDGQSALSVGFANYWPPKCPILKTDNGGTLWERKYTTNSQLWKVSFIKD